MNFFRLSLFLPSCVGSNRDSGTVVRVDEGECFISAVPSAAIAVAADAAAAAATVDAAAAAAVVDADVPSSVVLATGAKKEKKEKEEKEEKEEKDVKRDAHTKKRLAARGVINHLMVQRRMYPGWVSHPQLLYCTHRHNGKHTENPITSTVDKGQGPLRQASRHATTNHTQSSSPSSSRSSSPTSSSLLPSSSSCTVHNEPCTAHTTRCHWWTSARGPGSIPACCKRHLETLAEFVIEACDVARASCWINFGTLLGSVRDGGHIPWEDGKTYNNYIYITY